MRDANGKTIRGKRSGRAKRYSAAELHDIHSRIPGLPSGHNSGHAHNLHGKSATAAVEQSAILFDCSFIEETVEDHIVPRHSLTRQQLLEFRPQELEFEAIKTKQRDKDGRIVETTENRLAWRSDRTLLRRGNPFADAESGNRAGYRREGSVHVGANKRPYRESIPNARTDEKILGVEIEDANETNLMLDQEIEITADDLDRIEPSK
jgi:hypothetical protein